MPDDPAIDWDALLARVRAGDQQAATHLVEVLYPLVIKVVRAHLPRRLQEEELAQEVFVKMFTKMDQFSGTVPFSHWVSRIARFTCFDHLRRQRTSREWRMADLSEDEATALEQAADERGPVSASEAVSARDLLYKLMDELNPEDRFLMIEVELECRPIEEVCSEMRWSVTFARMRLFRARRKLKKVLETVYRKEMP